jgi:sec-independent protein translocase protein TatC
MSEPSQDQEMTILEHLRELRHRLIIAGIATAIGMAISAAVLTWPVITLLSEPAGLRLVALRPTETFVTYFKVALVTGAALAMPVIIWQALLFVLPALHSHERRWVFLGVPFITLAFGAGLAFGFFVVIPFAVRYLLSFGGDVITPYWSIEEYLTFITTLLFWIGLSFETPIVIFFLAKLGVVNPRSLGRFRRYAIVGAFVLGAIITPTPDPFNQSLVAIPMYLLYELGVLLARFA